MRVLAISGSLRKESHNTRLLACTQAAVTPAGVELDLLDDLRDIPPYDEDAEAEVPASVAEPTVEAARLTTTFTHPFIDGYIIVKVGADTIVQENLGEVSGRFIRRRTPKALNATTEIVPKNTDVQVWVVVPSQKVNEHHTLPHNFRPGTQQRLTITYNAQSKTFAYAMN